MKITNRQLRNLIKEEKAKLLKEQAAVEPALVSNKLLEGMLSSLEEKLMSEMRLDPEEVDAFAIDFMNRVGSNIETMLINLLEGRYREEY